MPWNDQSGGGGRGPWGQGPTGGGGGGGGSGGGGPTPPDIDDLLRRSQDNLKRMLPQGGLGGPGIFLLIALGIVGWLATGIFTVDEREQGIVLRFGEINRTVQPGLGYHLPWPVETVIKPEVQRIFTIDIGGSDNTGRNIPSSQEGTILTGDANIVDLDFSVQWKISDAKLFLFNIADPVNSVRLVSESAMREVVGRSRFDDLIAEGRQRVATEVQDLVQRTLDQYGAGIQIIAVQLKKAEPPSEVIDEFRDVERARADAERLKNEADAYRNKVIPEARGEAEQIIQQAQGYKEGTVAQARGAANRFTQIYEEYRKAPDVTRERLFLETMEEVLGGSQKVIIDQNAGGSSGVVPYLPLNELRRTQPQSQGGQRPAGQ